MSISSFAELQTAITNWTQRSDLTARLPEFITLAEAAFNRGFSESQPFRHFSQEANTTVSCSEYTTVPTDFLELRSIKGTWAPTKKLEYMTPEVMDLTYTSTTTANPKNYTMEAGSIRLGPAPSAGLTMKILYYQKIGPLSGGVNWLLTNHPDVYLFGSLLHGGVFAHDDGQLQKVIAGYNSAVNGLRTSDKRVRFGGGALQITAA
jgi:hypothetical protein